MKQLSLNKRSALTRALAVGLIAASTVGAFAQTSTEASAKRTRTAAQTADTVREEGVQPQLSAGSFSAYCTYRFSGSHVIVRCNDYRINANSRVFLSLSEYTINGPTDRFIGSARMSVHNVRPFNGGVEAWVDVEWGSPIYVRMDLLVDP